MSMSKVITESRPLPDITSDDISERSISGHQYAGKSSFLPPSYRLIVTTSRGVYAWDMDGVTELFRSGSEGIVAAKKLSGHGEILAVADSQVVILHDIKKGMQRSYRLKGSEGQVRLLKYAGNSSQNLFFTTSLRNSVQSYSLKHSKVLNPSDSHPSPPSVFALSCTAHVLLSTSASPPTIYLRNLGLSMSPILLRPRCSSSAVVAANFHPEAANIFLLAFADGSAAVYDASIILQSNSMGGSLDCSASSGAGGEVGSIKGLHFIGSKVKKHPAEDGDWVDDPDGTSVQAEAVSITAVALVPGHRALAVTVGADGKCCVVDFTQPTRRKAILLRSWHLRRPATALSVIYSKLPARASQLDGADELDAPANKDYCIAIGRQDGKVLLFDLNGKPLGKQILDPKGARVVDVEWAKKEVDATFAQTGLVRPDSRKGVPKRRSFGADVMRKVFKKDLAKGPKEQSDPLLDFSNRLPATPIAASKADNQVHLTHAIGLEVPSVVDTPKTSSDRGAEVDGCQSSPLPSSSGDSLLVDFSNSPPPIPPRPTPRPGGKLSERRSLTARGLQPQLNDLEPSALAVSRRKTVDDATPTKLPAPKASPTRGTFFGPRSPSDARAESWKQPSRGPPTYVFSTTYHDLLRDFNSSQPKLDDALSKPADSIDCTKPPMLAESLKPQPDPCLELLKPLPLQISAASLRSYKTASSRLDMSETSADTVLNWSVSASARRLYPSIHDSPPMLTTAQLSFLHERSPSDMSKTELRKIKREKGYESVNASTQTSPSSRSSVSQLSRNTAISDAVVHWPSLKKSPLIADLSAGVESATASVLDLGGYTDPPSPVKAQQQAISSPKRTERHSSSSSRKDRYIPPRLPFKISPSATSFQCDTAAHTCSCESNLQATITTSFHALLSEMDRGFKAQRVWLEELVRGREDGSLELQEENRLLKGELARVAKGKGRLE